METNLIIAGGSIVALIGGLCYWSGNHWSMEALHLCGMKVETAKALMNQAAAAKSVEIGPAVIRGIVIPASKDGALIEENIVGGVVVQDATYTSVHLAVQNAKLVERRQFLHRNLRSVDWVVYDETGIVRIDASLKENLPLRTLPPSMTAVRDSGHLQLLVSEHGFTLKSSLDTDRVIGIERVSSVLATGSFLTVIGHATLDPRGGLLFSMGVGPCAVSTLPLSAIIESWFSYASKMKSVGVICAALGGVIVVGGLAFSCFRKTREVES